MSNIDLSSKQLEHDIMDLIIYAPFYGHLLMMMERRAINSEFMAAVSIEKGSPILHINPYIYNNVLDANRNPTRDMRVAVLVHECEHIIRQHISRGKSIRNMAPKGITAKSWHKLLNISMDLALNQEINMESKTYQHRHGDFKCLIPNYAYFPTTPEKLTKMKEGAEKAWQKEDPATRAPINKFDEMVIKGEIFQHTNGLWYNKGELMTYDNIYEQYKDKEILPRLESMEKYVEFFLRNSDPPQQGDPGEPGLDGDEGDSEGQGMDDHDKMLDSDVNGDMEKDIVKGMMDKADKQAGGKSPEHIKRMLKEMNKPDLNWPSITRNFVSNQLKSKRIPTKTRVHRRFDEDQPGYKTKRELTVVQITDSSGSVTEELVSKIFNNAAYISKCVGDLWMIDCDDKVHSVVKYKKGMQPNIVGNGGTLFEPAFTAAAKLKPDAILYFTDGYNFDSQIITVSAPTLFIVYGEGGREPVNIRGKYKCIFIDKLK